MLPDDTIPASIDQADAIRITHSSAHADFTTLTNQNVGLRTVLDYTGAYIFTKDVAGCYTYVNQKVAELFGASLPEIVGKDDSHFFALELADQLRLNDRLVIDHGEALETEETNVLKATGETRIYWTIKKPLHDDSGQIIGMCGVSTDITERKAMENALRHNESHLRLSQTCGGIGTWEADLLNDRQNWSDSCVDLLGFPALQEPTWNDFLDIVHPDDRQQVIAATQAHIQSNTRYDVEYRILLANGNERWMRSAGEAERTQAGIPYFMRGIVQDVTERKRAQFELEQSLSLLQATLESTQDAILVVDLNGQWVLHNQRFLELWNITDAILTSNDDSAALSYVLNQLEDGAVFLSKVMELYAAPEATSFDTLKFRNGKIVERYSIPQKINQQIVGRVWSFRDVSEQVQAKQALKTEAEKNRAILHNASDGIHILDYDGNIIEVSDSFCAMLGYQRDEMIGMNVAQWDAAFVGSELLEVVRKQFDNPVRSEFSTRHRHKSGRIFDVEISGFPLQLNGKPALFNSSRDITQRLRIEAALRLKEGYQRALLDNFPFAVWLKDTESRFLAVNAEFAHVFGCNAVDDLIGKNDFDIAPADLAASYVADDRHVLSSRQNKNVEEMIFTAGERRWFETYKAPVIDENQQLLGSVGFARDITDRKQAQENLLLAASVFTYAREAIMITTPDGSIVNVNEAFSRITGYAREDVIGRKPAILQSGQQNKEFYQDLWIKLLNSGHWQGEIWNRRKNGEVYAEMLTVSAVHDAEDRITHYVALFSDITPQKEHEKQLEHIAHYDALTKLPNRVLLSDRLHLAMTQAIRRNMPLAVVYLDLDGFKAINDSYGHESGDQVLTTIADRMKHVMRDGDTLARLGGDEFVAVLVDLDISATCVPMLSRLLDAASEPVLVGGLPLQVSASLGVTFYPQSEDMNADQLLRQADQAMYQAKLSGKNRYYLFDPLEDSNIRSYHENLEYIRNALVRQEFVLHYQPKVNLQSGEVIGAEALIRWQHEQRGLLPPAAFLPMIEDHDLAIDVGEWVINTALEQMEQWQAEGLDIPVSVNICARHLQKDNFVERLSVILSAHPQIDPARLELEILETSALEDLYHVSRVIEGCGDFGVSFALDDFGTGYSSLTYLKRLPVAQIKIDQGFVRDMLEDQDDLSILVGVLGLARAFNRTIIAEGVETERHGKALLQLGCELAQGYGIARPMPAEKMPAWVKQWHANFSR